MLDDGRTQRKRRFAVASSGLLVSALVACGSHPQRPQVREIVGRDHGALYKIDVPAHWNRTLLLYSHGYVAERPRALEPKFRKAGAGPDPTTADWLLRQGYALAASLYAREGWAVQSALTDQSALVHVFRHLVGRPARVIAWGSSVGGLISVALVERQPQTFSGGLSMCGTLAGTAETLDTAFDSLFALKALLAPKADLIGSPARAAQQLFVAVAHAETTADGRARLALAAALSDSASSAEGAPVLAGANGLSARLKAETGGLIQLVRDVTEGAANLDALAGGSPFSNTGVNYARLLSNSTDRADVGAAYRAAGLDLANDLRILNTAAHVAPDRAAAAYVSAFYTPTGHLRRPLLTLHNVADPNTAAAQEGVYRTLAGSTGHAQQLRQLFIDRPGHCAFTPAETIVALAQLMGRIGGGRWPRLGPYALDGAARRLGADLNSDGRNASAPAFVAIQPPALPRTLTGSTARSSARGRVRRAAA